MHYADFCGLFDIVKVLSLIIDNSCNADTALKPRECLHLASQEGHWHVEVER